MVLSSRPHPAQVPTLTEVIELPSGEAPPDALVPPSSAPPVVAETASASWPDAAPAEAAPPVAMPATVSSPPPPASPRPDSMRILSEPIPMTSGLDVDMDQLAALVTQRVLGDVQKQVDGMLEFRLREAMAPVLARHAEAMVQDLKEELRRTMRDVVTRSVAQEVAKLRHR